MARTVSIDFVGRDQLSRIQKKVSTGFKKIKTGATGAETSLKKYNKRQKATAIGMKNVLSLIAFGSPPTASMPSSHGTSPAATFSRTRFCT